MAHMGLARGDIDDSSEDSDNSYDSNDSNDPRLKNAEFDISPEGEIQQLRDLLTRVRAAELPRHVWTRPLLHSRFLTHRLSLVGTVFVKQTGMRA
jgi:hypothetical protein